LVAGRVGLGTALLAVSLAAATPAASAKSHTQKCDTHAGSHADLAGCNLSDKSLRGLDLAYANLTDADLTGVNVTRTKLGHAKLAGARSGRLHGKPTSLPQGYRCVHGYLIGSSVSLADADLSGADLSGADLSGADLSRAALSGTIVAGADFHDANLSHASLKGARQQPGTPADRCAVMRTRSQTTRSI
jgi:uncharacterized protein YjbI with pentapeptide repeats